jgi:hypothetical protein
MRPLAKVGLVGAGYTGAFAIASAVVTVYVAATSGPDRQSSGGMFAFGDSLLFLAVFGVVAVVPTGAALFFLRPYRAFWSMLSVTALVVATTAVAAFVDYVASQGSDAHSVANTWPALAVLRILIAPLLALAFLVSAVIAPNRRSRLALLVATAIEASVFVYVAFIWLHPFRSH